MIELRSSIEEVRVHRAAAEITRTVELVRGTDDFPELVAVVGLPLALEDGSVRVRIDAGEGVLGAPIALDARIALDASLGARKEAAPDERAVRSAREEEAQSRAMVERLAFEMARIERAPMLPRPKTKRGERPAASPTFARLELGAFVRERVLALAEELAAARKTLERAAERRAEAEASLARASSSREAKPDELRKAVVVTISRAVGSDAASEAIGPDRVKLIVTYLVPGARWAPAYTLRVSKGEGAKREAELSMRAVVCQRTGEDWSGVKLSLSTANATRWTELPELKSLRVGRAQAGKPMRGWRPLPEGLESLFEDYDRASALFAATHRTAAPSPAQTSHARPTSARQMAHAFQGHKTDATAKAPAMLARSAPSMPSFGGFPGRGAPPPASQGYGAPMEAQAFAMPASAPSDAPMDAKRSGGLLGSMGRAKGARAAQRSPSGSAERDALSFTESEQGAVTDDREVVLAADPRMLGFASLRMASPQDSRRGTLTVLAERESYLELRLSERSFVHLDIENVIEEAQSLAREVATTPPPARHQSPSAVDGFDHAYDCESPADVPSDGVFHSIPILTTRAEARMHYVTVPRESRDVFRYAEIQSSLDAPLLAGPLEVYVGRDYLLSTDLPATPARGYIKLGLGVDSAIKVARNTDFSEQVTGLMRGSLDLKHKIRIELANNKAESADIEVRERLPSVREKEEDIRVEVGSVDPPWEPYEQDESKLAGGHAWRIVLEPGKKKTLEVTYVVRIAAKNELIGGNRRETP